VDLDEKVDETRKHIKSPAVGGSTVDGTVIAQRRAAICAQESEQEGGEAVFFESWLWCGEMVISG
jgi:hypothetical protein